MKNRLVAPVKRVVPAFIYNGLKGVYDGVKRLFKGLFFRLKLKRVHRNYKQVLSAMREKDKIRVAFFLVHESVWKYDGIYALMEQDERFEPVVVVCPYVTFGEKTMLHDLEHSYRVFSDKGYRVIKTLKEDGSWMDVKEEVKPDMVFFTNPYFLTKPEYYILNFLDTLTFYIPYGFMITDRPAMQYNQELHNLVFRVFHESAFHHGLAMKYSLVKGRNSVVTGYPGLDPLLGLEAGCSTSLVWKDQRPNVKRIIWAPHHSIEVENTAFNYSNFLSYCDFFLELADKYSDAVCFAFKPHPILRSKLYDHPDWGEAKTKAYYDEWDRRANCQLHEEDYVDLFLTSDAMIHDSGSFLAEYISTGNPSLYMIRNDSILRGFSELGTIIIDCHYHSYTKAEVEAFINEVVIQGKDPLKEERGKLIDNYLTPPFGISAGQTIFNEIVSLVKK